MPVRNPSALRRETHHQAGVATARRSGFEVDAGPRSRPRARTGRRRRSPPRAVRAAARTRTARCAGGRDASRLCLRLPLDAGRGRAAPVCNTERGDPPRSPVPHASVTHGHALLHCLRADRNQPSDRPVTRAAVEPGRLTLRSGVSSKLSDGQPPTIDDREPAVRRPADRRWVSDLDRREQRLPLDSPDVEDPRRSRVRADDEIPTVSGPCERHQRCVLCQPVGSAKVEH